MTAKKKWKKKKEKELELDGKKAYLPHPVFQNCLFAATRERHADEYRKRSVTIRRENKWGDILTIRSARTLFARPDMGVFLATVALVQKNGFQRLVGEEDGRPSNRLVSTFSIRDLYDLTRMGRSSARERLLTSLETLGSVSLSVKYADREKHKGQCSLSLASFWDLQIIPQKGRKGSLVNIYPADFLIPQKTFLWGDAETCNKLRGDTARGIFWGLICREHMTGTAEEWHSLVGSDRGRIDMWKKNQFADALDELREHKYVVEENEDGTITVKRPTLELLELEERKGQMYPNRCKNVP